jgi:hypothetical protein
MSSYDNQETDQFKLISLDSNNIKPVAQKAKQAYSSYLKDDENPQGTSSLSVNEDEPPAPPPAVTTKTGSKPLPKEEKTKPTTTGRLYKRDHTDDDDDFNERIENVSSKIEELKESIKVLWINFISTFSAIFLKISAILIKPLVVIAGFLARLLSVPLNIINRLISTLAERLGVKNKEIRSTLGDDEDEEIVEQAAEIKTATFSEMIELNIIFTDNYKKNLYNKPQNAGFKLSKMEEGLIFNMAIEAIKECAEFTSELPPPGSGIYKDIPIYKIMEDVAEQDVLVFLGFVKTFPGKYIGKTWKISETFATWLINNSPTG